MKKSILSIGTVLSSAEQKKVSGGGSKGNPFCIEYIACQVNSDCCPWQICSPMSDEGGICN